MDVTYRTNVDEFIRATEWDVPDGTSLLYRRNMANALRYFCNHVPVQKLDEPSPTVGLKPGQVPAFRPFNKPWTQLMGWMQAIDFRDPVDPACAIEKGCILLAFHWPQDNAFGRFYTLIEGGRPAKTPTNKGLGVPLAQNAPCYYEAKHRFACLRTTAADAFLSWVAPGKYKRSYARGGKSQWFIWQPKDHLTLLV